MRSDRWVLAVRVSTEDQEVEQQEDALQAAASRLGATVAVVLRFEGDSGWEPKSAREVMRRMLEPIERGEADTLAVWALDRVLRLGIKETLIFLERLEKHLGGKLYSLQEPFLSTATMNPEMRELMASFTAYIANRESGHKSARVKARRDTKVNRAAALGQQATWGRGYLATPSQVSRIWELSDDGRSVRFITAEVGVSKSQVSRVLGRARPAATAGVPGEPPGRSGAARVAVAPSEGGGLGHQATASVPVVPEGRPENGQANRTVPVKPVEPASAPVQVSEPGAPA